jgi:hypothetical protein
MNLVFSTRLPRLGLAALALVSAVIAAPRFANASAANVTFAVPTITVQSEPFAQTGYFDVTLTDTAADKLGQFQAVVTLSPGASGISIVGGDLGQNTNGEDADPTNNSFGATNPDGIGDAAGASPNLIDTYALSQVQSPPGDYYDNNNSGGLQNGALVGFTTTTAQNSDESATANQLLTANTVYSMLQVYYSIPANATAGSYALTLNNITVNNPSPGNADYVNLVSSSNTTSNLAPGTTINGAIVVTPGVMTPEPASVVLMLFGAIGLIGMGVRRARRA